jgi:AcrR family transcriptional regulator
MSLFEEHKAERRTRILKAAKQLVGDRGYEGLTMRDLARASKVSVPTLYNLFGSKDAILLAELQAMSGAIAAALPRTGDSFFARGMVAFDAGMRIIEDSPAFFRAVVQMFMTSPATDEVRRRTEHGFIAVMEANLAAAKAAGQLADWAEPQVVARHMWAQHMALFLAWGLGAIDLPTFKTAATSGVAHLLVGVALGPFHDEVEAQIRAMRGDLERLITQEASHASARHRES